MSLITAVVLLWLTEAVSLQMIWFAFLKMSLDGQIWSASEVKVVQKKQQQTLQTLKERHFSLLLTALLVVMLLCFLLCVAFSGGCFSNGEESNHRKLFKLQLAHKANGQISRWLQSMSVTCHASAANSVAALVLPISSAHTLIYNQFTWWEAVSCLYLPAAIEAISSGKSLWL